jgi:hypothetical protein
MSHLDGVTAVYVTVKITWIIFAVGVGLVVFCARKWPGSVIPLSLGIAAATALAAILHL